MPSLWVRGVCQLSHTQARGSPFPWSLHCKGSLLAYRDLRHSRWPFSFWSCPFLLGWSPLPFQQRTNQKPSSIKEKNQTLSYHHPHITAGPLEVGWVQWVHSHPRPLVQAGDSKHIALVLVILQPIPMLKLAELNSPLLCPPPLITRLWSCSEQVVHNIRTHTHTPHVHAHTNYKHIL